MLLRAQICWGACQQNKPHPLKYISKSVFQFKTKISPKKMIEFREQFPNHFVQIFRIFKTNFSASKIHLPWRLNLLCLHLLLLNINKWLYLEIFCFPSLHPASLLMKQCFVQWSTQEQHYSLKTRGSRAALWGHKLASTTPQNTHSEKL